MASLADSVRSLNLPPGWVARRPTQGDVIAMCTLANSRRRPGSPTSVDVETVAATVIGTASWTRRQLIVDDPAGQTVAWAITHDRAAGRTAVDVIVLPDTPRENELAAELYQWIESEARTIASLRNLPRTQLDASPRADDLRQRRWLAEAGYAPVRTWLQMTRPVSAADAAPDAIPGARPGVLVRRVRSHGNGLPVAQDLQLVHLLLQESFVDHFNSYREGFAEFVERLQEDHWHRWDHWWIATVEIDGQPVPSGALIGSMLPEDSQGIHGSYIDYIGVHRRARGRGVAKALLHTVIADAAFRQRNRVGLEVDANSSTGADGLYLSLGWRTDYQTESWHRHTEPADAA